MKRDCFCLNIVLLFVFASCCLQPILANVNMTTTIEDIDYRGRHELAGTMTFTVNGNDFFFASPETPVYVKLRLDKAVTLSETRVAPAPFLTLHRPIYLAAFLHESSNATLNMPANAIALARWKAGESEFWLRVVSNSSDWINRQGFLVAPSPNYPVRFRLGISGEVSSQEADPLFQIGKANRASNADVQGNSVSTQFFVNAATSLLTVFPEPHSELEFDVIAFDHQTSGVESEENSALIWSGGDSGAHFSGEDLLAVAHDFGRSVPALGSMGAWVLAVSLLLLAIQRRRALL